MRANWVSSLGSCDPAYVRAFVGAALLDPLAPQLLSLVNTRIDFEDMLYGHAKGELVTEPMGMMLGTLVTFDPQRAALDGPFGRHLDVLVKHLLREHPLVQKYKLMIELSTVLEDSAVILPPRAVQQLMAAARRRDPRGAASEHEARVSGDSADDDAGDSGCDDGDVPAPAAPAPPAPRGHAVSSVMPANARSYGVTPGPDKGSFSIGRLILRGSGATQRLESSAASTPSSPCTRTCSPTATVAPPRWAPNRPPAWRRTARLCPTACSAPPHSTCHTGCT